MPTIVKRVSNACAQGTRWRATPNAREEKTRRLQSQKRTEETTNLGWLTFTPVKWLSFKALQT